MDNTKPSGSAKYALRREGKHSTAKSGNRHIPLIFAIFFILLSVDGHALTGGGSGLDAGTLPEGANVGICIRTTSGKTLKEVNADRNFIPASNLKAVTAALALQKLGTDFRFTTAVAYSGQIDGKGVLRGDLYIVGGGDPTLGSDSPIAVPRDSLFADWERAVRNAGIRRIEGRIVGDSRAMPCRMRGSWMYEDLGTYYGASCSGLMFNRNRLEMTLRPGEREGAAVRLPDAERPDRRRQVFIPEDYPWMRIENCCTTGAKGSGDQSYLLVSEFAPLGRLVGTYAIDRQAKKLSFNDPFADFTLAYEFAMHLYTSGIPSAGVTATSSCHPTASFYARPAGMIPAPSFGFESFGSNGSSGSMSGPCGQAQHSGDFLPAGSLTLITITQSPKLWSIVRETLRESDNLFAETLLRALALKILQGAETVSGWSPVAFPDTDEALEAERSLLAELGVGVKGIRIDDGSGLSRKTAVSPRFMTEVLLKTLKQSCGKDYLLALNTPGPDERLLSGATPEVRKRLRLKSGSMGGVLCYCGYILPTSEQRAATTAGTSKTSIKAGKTQDSPGGPQQTRETVVFSIMINGATQSSAELRSFIESVLMEYLQ